MITLIATVEVKAGEESEFERLFCELAGCVHDNEPGTVVYELTRPRSEPAMYSIVEVYESDTAWQTHKSASYTQDFVPQLHQLFASARADIYDSAWPLRQER